MAKLVIKETLIKNSILDYLHYKNIFCWLNNTSGNYSIKTNSYYKNPRLLRGVADIIGLLPDGRLLAIECKSGKNRQSAEQINFQNGIVGNKGIYILAYSLDDVEFALNKIRLLTPYVPTPKN